jgi:hypothetical protein
MGFKHAESKNPVSKGRIVLQGSNVRDTDSNMAMFQEVSCNQTNLKTMRSCVSYCGLDDEAVCESSDAEVAYVQHVLTPEDGPPVWIRLPRAWLPSKFSATRDPVFRWNRPLYGHPCAGRIWEKHLEKSYTNVDGNPWKDTPTHG